MFQLLVKGISFTDTNRFELQRESEKVMLLLYKICPCLVDASIERELLIWLFQKEGGEGLVQGKLASDESVLA